MAEPGTSFDARVVAEQMLSMEEGVEREAFYRGFTNKQRKAINSELAKIDAEQKAEFPALDVKAGDEEEEVSMYRPSVFTPGTTVTGIGAGVAATGGTTADLVTDDEIMQMWTEIEKFDVSQINPEDLRIFEYEGFNPDEILRSLMKQKKVNNIADANFHRDMAVLCGLAIVKGNVNDNNFKKMKKTGQDTFTKLQATYGLKLGSARNMSSDVVTVARVAATFPGTIIRLLHDNKISARSFVGPMKSTKLPGILRHQALAACIPRELGDETKNFFISVITAFSVDQSLTITKVKKDPATVAGDQVNFIRVAHEGRYPRENIRKAIFNSYTWVSHYQEMALCVRELSRLDDSHKIVELDQFRADVNKLAP